MKLWPGAPALFICDSDALYKEFKRHIYDYMATWRSWDFINYATGMCNSNNPFAYNYRSRDTYFAMYLKVFRRQTVMMPQYLYNEMLREGLFDENHIIGEVLCIILALIGNTNRSVQVNPIFWLT